MKNASSLYFLWLAVLSLPDRPLSGQLGLSMDHNNSGKKVINNVRALRGLGFLIEFERLDTYVIAH